MTRRPARPLTHVDPAFQNVLNALDRTLTAAEEAVKLGVSLQPINSPSFRSPTSQEGIKRQRKRIRMNDHGHFEDV